MPQEWDEIREEMHENKNSIDKEKKRCESAVAGIPWCPDRATMKAAEARIRGIFNDSISNHTQRVAELESELKRRDFLRFCREERICVECQNMLNNRGICRVCGAQQPSGDEWKKFDPAAAYEKGLKKAGSLENVRNMAEQGDAEMQYVLGVDHVIENCPHEAFPWWEKAAEQGHVLAQFSLGNFHNEPALRMLDKDKAANWWQKAAEQGHWEAKARLAEVGIAFPNVNARKSRLKQGIVVLAVVFTVAVYVLVFGFATGWFSGDDLDNEEPPPQVSQVTQKPEVSSSPTVSTEPIRTSSPVSNLSAVYAAYYEVLQGFVDDYGILDGTDDGWGKGLEYAELIDFGKDGIPELLFLYDDGEGGSPGNWYCNVYGFSGKAELYYEGYEWVGADFGGGFSIAAAHNGIKYLHCGFHESAGGEDRYYSLKEGKWTEILSLSSEQGHDGEWFTGEFTYSVNGISVDKNTHKGAAESQLGIVDEYGIPNNTRNTVNAVLAELERHIGSTEDKTIKTIPVRYAVVKPFSEGFAAVGAESGIEDDTGYPICKWGFIDRDGNEIIPCQYDYVESFSDGFAAVTMGCRAGYVDKNGNETLFGRYDRVSSFSEGLAAVCKDEKWGYIDKTGAEVIPCAYGEARPFSDGAAWIRPYSPYIPNQENENEYSYALIDKTGTQVFPQEYSFVNPFFDGLAIVDGGGTVIDKTGRIVASGYTYIQSFSEGMAAAGGTHYGFIDKDGNEVIPSIYADAQSFSEGLAAVCMDDKWGFVDKEGNEVIPCTYDLVSPFSNGTAAVCIGGEMIPGEGDVGGKWGIIDKNGEIIIPVELEYLVVWSSSYSEGFLPVNVDNKWGYISVS